MNSQTVKAAFAAKGIKVRVRDFGLKFRICDASKALHGDAMQAVAVELGFTSAAGNAGGQWNTGMEFIAYKPGAVVRG